MDLSKALNNVHLSEEINNNVKNQFINVFKNPSKLPITQIHLEKTWVQLKTNVKKDSDFITSSAEDIRKNYFEKKSEIIPALDKRWLPKCILHTFEPYVFTMSPEENSIFISKNVAFIETLEFLLECNFHQFWCLVLFEQSFVHSLRSFILNPISPCEVKYLENEFREIYNKVFTDFLLVYERLIDFDKSAEEHIPSDYATRHLVDKKLLNLPIVISLAYLYKNSNQNFANRVTNVYFSDTSQLDFQIKEVEEIVKQSVLILEMIGGYVCGFDKDAVVIPIALERRPAVFDLKWIYSVVNYLVNTLSTLHVLFEFYKPAVEMALSNEFPYRIPFMYVNIFRELYVFMDDRDEVRLDKVLSERIMESMNLARSELVDIFHIFTSFCLDETLKYLGDTKKQETVVETYLKLLTTALDDDFFICDYNLKHNVRIQNEMFESCYPLDPTRTEFIVSCIDRLPRNKRLETLCRTNPNKIESIFKKFEPPISEEPQLFEICEPSTSSNHNNVNESEIEAKIKDIMDMFPHLGDGFILQCLEHYSLNSTDVINAILEQNLPPHLNDIPFDTIRIPPEPEPAKPTLAYKGKKPGHSDAMSLLNDKSDIQKIKTFVLEGIQYTNDYLYDDEYDDRDDEIPVKVTDNPLTEDIPLSNPNHTENDRLSDSSSDNEEEDSQNVKPQNSRYYDKSKVPFCEDPAVIRERREAQFRLKTKNPQRSTANVVGNPKGQGQDKSVLLSRQKKNVNKSTRANHNRKGGATWKRSRGMMPF